MTAYGVEKSKKLFDRALDLVAAVKGGINVKKAFCPHIYTLSSFLATLTGTIYVLKYITGKSDATSFVQEQVKQASGFYVDCFHLEGVNSVLSG